MVVVGMEKVYPVRCKSESWFAKARQDTLSRSPDKPTPSRHQPCIFYISKIWFQQQRVIKQTNILTLIIRLINFFLSGPS
jgi:hypothetical protein